MLLLPLLPDIRAARWPWVTFALVLLCTGIHLLNEQRQATNYHDAWAFCGAAPVFEIETPGGPVAERLEQGQCAELLLWLHEYPDTDYLVDYLAREAADDRELEFTAEAVRSALLQFYTAYAVTTPPSIVGQYAYISNLPNPLRAISSALLHADWGHLVGNMIFFIAFAMIVEPAVGSVARYLGLLLGVGLAAVAVYHAVHLFDPHPAVVVGFSGVVSGVIGIAAYLVPRVPIKTLFWFLFYARVFYIPAWALALWFIGWDLYDLIRQGGDFGVALSAHVGGAFAGYGLARLWLKERREEIEDELADAIEHARARRADSLGTLSSYTYYSRRQQAEEARHAETRAFEDFLQRLHRASEGRQRIPAVLLFAEWLERRPDTLGFYREVWERANQWAPSVVLLDIARLYIGELLRANRDAEALLICARACQIAPEFLLADPARELLRLLEAARAQREFGLAGLLVRAAGERYGSAVDAERLALEEVRLLCHERQDLPRARALVATLMRSERPHIREQAVALARQLLPPSATPAEDPAAAE